MSTFYVILYRSPLNVFDARQARDTVMKMIYAHLFNFIIISVNHSFRCKSSELSKSINILDIAGFGIYFEHLSYFQYWFVYWIYRLTTNKSDILIFIECFAENQFEQFCINYANEKIQNFCTRRLIIDELEWYKVEGINVPEIEFPGNDIVLSKSTLYRNSYSWDVIKMYTYFSA